MSRKYGWQHAVELNLIFISQKSPGTSTNNYVPPENERVTIKIKEEKSKLLITIESKGPKPTDMVTMVLTQPIHIVKIPKTKKDIVFVTE